MFQKYFSKFFHKTQRKKNSSLRRKLIPTFLEQKNVRKYQKRRKNIFQKICKKIALLSEISSRAIVIFWIIILCVSWFFFILFSSYTSISKINIYREWALIDINRAYTIVDYLRGKSIMSINNIEIAQRLQKSQSAISEIKINKDFPNTINIFLGSYEVLFQTKNHFILANGAVVPQENETSPETVSLFISQDISEYVDFQRKINPKYLRAIQVVIDEAQKNILWFEPSKIYYFIRERELLIKDTLETIYIFDLEQSIETQIRKLAIYNQETESNSPKSQVYIDVRISEKLFLCSRQTEAICKNNLEQIYETSIFWDPLPEVSESQQ